ncbi:Proline-rich protein 1 [Camellia lanceoleosa]|uniref:Proline-rich protein 1 n=1 Tax=Camellia lanceoleosa TaxID=1840588 RepID=A0ACC0F708_9ERIC|nr:Proline-rich protein 1 [Camellia lanceoleosa]
MAFTHFPLSISMLLFSVLVVVASASGYGYASKSEIEKPQLTSYNPNPNLGYAPKSEFEKRKVTDYSLNSKLEKPNLGYAPKLEFEKPKTTGYSPNLKSEKPNLGYSPKSEFEKLKTTSYSQNPNLEKPDLGHTQKPPKTTAYISKPYLEKPETMYDPKPKTIPYVPEPKVEKPMMGYAYASPKPMLEKPETISCLVVYSDLVDGCVPLSIAGGWLCASVQFYTSLVLLRGLELPSFSTFGVALDELEKPKIGYAPKSKLEKPKIIPHVPKPELKKPTAYTRYAPKPELEKPNAPKPMLEKPKTGGYEFVPKPQLDKPKTNGALARITCQAINKNGYESAPFSVLSHPTNSEGYFSTTVSPYELEDAWKLTECKVLLEKSPLETYKVPTDVNKGISGAPLSSYSLLKDENIKLYSVGPFFTLQNLNLSSNGY